MEANEILCGDSCEILESAQPACVDLVFADPPYNIGYVYDRYDDDRPDAEYVAWCARWMRGVHRILKPNGSFYLAIGDDFAADLRIVGREIGFHLRNWIIWHYTFGQNARTKFGRSHTHILYFTKDRRNFTFNDRLLRYPSARHTEYQDLRASSAGRVPDDTWDDIPRVCGTFKERAGFHGCQLPEALLTRIILASSNPGDVVLDPFVGSGTTAVTAKRLGRQFVGIDLSEEYVQRTRERLAKVECEIGASRADGRWPALHEDLLAQLYRETGVILENLLPNEVAMRVVAHSLSARAGVAYASEAVAEKLCEMRASGRLPKLPNDTPFVARQHVTSEGKRYVRKVMRIRTRSAGQGTGRRRRRPVTAQSDSSLTGRQLQFTVAS